MPIDVRRTGLNAELIKTFFDDRSSVSPWMLPAADWTSRGVLLNLMPIMEATDQLGTCLLEFLLVAG